MALAKFVFDVITLFPWLPLPISLDKLVLPLGRTEAQSYPREGFSLWRSFCHIPSFDMWESEAQRGQELAGEHTAVLRYENSHQQTFDPELFSSLSITDKSHPSARRKKPRPRVVIGISRGFPDQQVAVRNGECIPGRGGRRWEFSWTHHIIPRPICLKILFQTP